MKRFYFLLLLLIVPLAAMADTYRITYSWTAPSYPLPGDTPTYGAWYRIDNGTPVAVPDSATPSGVIDYTAAPAALFKMCVQNKNGAKVMPVDCTTASPHWVTVGASPPAPTTDPPMPSGFSATIIWQGP